MTNSIKTIEKLFKEFDSISNGDIELRKKIMGKIGEVIKNINETKETLVNGKKDFKKLSELEIRHAHISGILDLNPDYFDQKKIPKIENKKNKTKSLSKDDVNFFPYKKYRKYQEEGIEKVIFCAKKGIPLIMDSPTGTGKSIMILSGLLKILKNEDKIVVLTRTHSQYDAFIKEVRTIQDSGTKLNCGILAGREGLCPIGVSSTVCSKAKYNSRKSMKNGFSIKSDKRLAYSKGNGLKTGKVKQGCPYFTNTVDYLLGENGHYMKPTHGVKKILNNHKKHPYFLEDFKTACINLTYPACPYEAMKFTLKDSNVMILHYLYFFDSEIKARMVESEVFQTASSIHLVIDEGHNTGFYIIDLNTHAFSVEEVRESINFLELDLKGRGNFDLRKCSKSVKKSIDILSELLENLNYWINNNISFSFDGLEKDFILGVEYFQNNIIVSGNGSDIFSLGKKGVENILKVNKTVENQLNSDGKSFESITELETPSFCNVANVLNQLLNSNDEKFVVRIIVSPKNQESLGELSKGLNIKLEVKDVDPRGKISELVEFTDSMTLISGTFSPIEKFRDFLFDKKINVETHQVPNPFPKENRRIYTLKDMTSLYRLRNDTENKSSINNTIEAICKDNASSAIFFTSYSFLNEWKPTIDRMCEQTGKKVFYEKKGDDKKAVLNAYKKLEDSLLVGVLGGSFSEGINLPGNQLNLVAVIGLQLAPRTHLQTRIESYYNGKGLDGVGLTYNLPAVIKSVQAIGRCLRSEKDRGVLILGDNRYTQSRFKDYLPDWINEDSKIIHSTQLEDELKGFERKISK